MIIQVTNEKDQKTRSTGHNKKIIEKVSNSLTGEKSKSSTYQNQSFEKLIWNFKNKKQNRTRAMEQKKHNNRNQNY